MGVRRHLAALLAPLLLLVVACGAEDPKPKIAPSPSAPVSSASPAEPVVSASPVVVETPEAFIRRWVELSNDMQNSGDAKEFRAASKGCRTCLDLANRIEAIYAAGGYVRTDGITIVGISSEVRLSGTSEFLVEVSEAPTTYVRAQGAAQEFFTGGATRYRFIIAKLPETWRMASFIDTGES